MQPITFAPHTFAATEHARSAAVRATLAPFVGAVVREQRRTGDLRAALAQAATAEPDALAMLGLRPGAATGPDPLPPGEVLFPEADPVTGLRLGNLDSGDSLTIEMADATLGPEVAAFLHRCAAGRSSLDQLRASGTGVFDELIDELWGSGLLVPRGPPRRAPVGHARAITRLEHACLLIRSATSTVLVDPVVHSSAPDASTLDIPFGDLPSRIDAILISHSHSDHFSPASLMMFSRDVPVVVPRVERPNLLCPDMAAELRRLGFRRVIDVPWYAPPLRFGDIQVDVLPFFGEQPLLHEAPRDVALRNWGNTYLVSTPDFRAWILIDSGNDHAGRMEQVALDLRGKVGPVDLVLSNLREFYVGIGQADPCYITGAGEYWLSLTASQLERFPSMQQDLLTLGPAGAARVCAAVGARAFLPYAHWWQAPGQPVPDEGDLRAALAERLAEERCPTEVVDWTVGDGFRRAGDAFVRVPGGQAGQR
jgi:L-ascorbate metabolism protein UlaG (beta-lactamase superfamily)